ncbi:MAG TPA: GTPase HflX [Hyphomicrobiaceae bacterium]|nr:GTPase HflX [Hyphomicrobiaceae bacterium]
MLLPVRAGTRPQARSDGRPAAARRNERNGKAPARADRSSPDRLQEAVGLAEAIGLDVQLAETFSLARPRPATLLGSGKVEEIAGHVREHGVGLVIIDHVVSPIQQRNLEKAWGSKVLDRTGLILEIFGERALTREGRLQVELAHLTYQRGRLVRSWTHLERQRGGFGFLGGPGEAQIETDRRLIQERIDAIKKDLAGVIRTRGLHRASRQRIPLPVAAIVGYTNAGKSTLFNRLTGASVLAIDQVFATLDPTMREITLPSGRRIVLSDTVGFISDLPTNLIAAFRATLEEVVAADLILHVRDVSHPESEAQHHDVVAVLVDLGIDADSETAPILEVWNKADKLTPGTRTEVERARARRNRPAVLVSALTGEGIEALRAQLDADLGRHDEVFDLEIPADQGRLLSWLHANAEVLDQKTEGSGAVLARIRIEPAAKGKLAGQLKRAGLSPLGVQERK